MSLRTEQDKYISHITVLLELTARENNNDSVTPKKEGFFRNGKVHCLRDALLSCETSIQ